MGCPMDVRDRLRGTLVLLRERKRERLREMKSTDIVIGG